MQQRLMDEVVAGGRGSFDASWYDKLLATRSNVVQTSNAIVEGD